MRDKKFDSLRARFVLAGFLFYRVYQPGRLMARYFCSKNNATEKFETLAEARTWLARHLDAKKSGQETLDG
jgi:hypothetical protein